MDVDLDTTEARALAPHFLPETDWVHGRAGSPGSHYIYIAPGVNTERFADPLNGKMIIEQRAEGCQTMVPPSRHASGERVIQEREGIPSRVFGDQLQQGVRRVATAALLVRHYPTRGGRHHAINALVGMLIRGGWWEQEVIEFVTIIARAAGDEEWTERGRGQPEAMGWQGNSGPGFGFITWR